MLADKSTSNLYILFESLIKKKGLSLKATSQTLQHKQPSLNSVSLKNIYFTLPLPNFAIKVSQIKYINNANKSLDIVTCVKNRALGFP